MESSKQTRGKRDNLTDMEFPANPIYTVMREVKVGTIEEGDGGHPHVALVQVALADLKLRNAHGSIEEREVYRVWFSPEYSHTLTLNIEKS